MVNYGWVCPKCGRVYAPNQEMCLYCGGGSMPQPRKQEGISWLNGTLSTATKEINTVDSNQWLSVTSCSTDMAVDASKVSNNIAIDKTELTALVSDTIGSKKENYE